MGRDREGRPIFFDPRGGTHYEGRWQPPELPKDPVAALAAANEIEPDGWTPSARWEREHEIPDEVYFAASATM